MKDEIPFAINRGWQCISIDGVKKISAPIFVDDEEVKNKWVFEVQFELILKKTKNKTNFPERTNWFVVLDSDYPYGDIEVYPSKSNGINDTYNHQTINIDIYKNLPWRYGKLCLEQPIRSLGLLAGINDPIGNIEERISWYLNRSQKWILAAATNSLINKNDPFETPFYPVISDTRIVHDESEESFCIWKDHFSSDWGFFVAENLPGFDNVHFVAAYFTQNGDLIRTTSKYDKTKHTIGNPKLIQGIWWLWPSPVVLKPWKAPINWGELRTIGDKMAINVDGCMKNMIRNLRGLTNVFMMLGYPIPKKVGEKPIEIFWEAISLPEFKAKAGGKPPNGFRSNEAGWWQRDKRTILKDDEYIKYTKTENWHSNRVQARGRFSLSLRKSKVALIGCGALGSIIAELLVRGGVSEALFIDHDNLVIGNLVRHTLSGCDIQKNKAEALKERLQTVAPFSKITSYPNKFPTRKKDIIELLDDYDIVIDCTASNEVISCLSLGWWSLEKLFISAAVGYEAKRLFVFTHIGQEFPKKDFFDVINPYILKEQSLWEKKGETLEGAGCWSPLFPARWDDILLAGSTMIKILEETKDNIKQNTQLVVFDQIYEGEFKGMKRKT